MNTPTTNDELGLLSEVPADFGILTHLAEVSAVEQSEYGSALASSLLKLPEAFSEGTAAVILDAVPLLYTDTATDLKADFEKLAELDSVEKALDPCDTSILEEVLELSGIDTELARVVYQTSRAELEAIRPLGHLETLRLFREELRTDTGEATAGQLQLLLDSETAYVAARTFPAAQQLLEELTEEDEPTPAEARRLDRIQRAERNRIVGAGNRQLHGVDDLQIMITLNEDPVAIVSMALNSFRINDDLLIDLLEKADDHQIFNWLFGQERQAPKPGQIGDLMSRFTEDRIKSIAKTCQKQLPTGDAARASLPWIAEIIEHVYIPRLLLDPASATLVYHELEKKIGDDTPIWVSVMLADTGEEPVHLQDLI